VDPAGLDSLDRRYLRALIENYAGGPVDGTGALGLGEVPHPPQQAPGHPRRAPGPGGDLAGAVFGQVEPQPPGGVGQNLDQLVRRIEFQPDGDAEPVPQGGGQHARPGGGRHQGEGGDVDAD